MTLPPSYDSWLESPYTGAVHDCPTPDECRCVEEAEDAREAALLARGEADRDADRDDAEDARARRG